MGQAMGKNSKPATAAQVIRDRRNAILNRRGWLDLLLRVSILAAVLWFLFTQVFLLCQLSGNAMFPALKDGDLLIGYRLKQQYQKGDIVLYHMDGKVCASRIAASGGDVVDISEDGRLYVNNAQQADEILFPTEPRENISYPYEVPKGHLFVLGDYRTRALDSRDFGPLPETAVEAKLISILRRRGL